MSTIEPGARVRELPEISLEAVKSVVAASLFELDEGLEDRLAAIIEDGNRYLQPAHGEGEDREAYRLARENLQKLVQAMVDDAVQRGRTMLDEAALVAAMRRLCPLPPWCR